MDLTRKQWESLLEAHMGKLIAGAATVGLSNLAAQKMHKASKDIEIKGKLARLLFMRKKARQAANAAKSLRYGANIAAIGGSLYGAKKMYDSFKDK
jgi:hypothetical protein